MLNNKADAQQLDCWFHIIAQVKKTEKPWVVFKTHFEEGVTLYDAGDELFTYKNLTCDAEELSDAISSYSLHKSLQWEAYGVHESFKNPDTPSGWYSACITACKAAEHLRLSAHNRLNVIPQNPSSDIEFDFYKPVVILDGILLATELSKDGIIDVDELPAASLRFYYSSQACPSEQYHIDIVTLQGLESYISMCEARHEAIFDRINKHCVNARRE